MLAPELQASCSSRRVCALNIHALLRLVNQGNLRMHSIRGGEID
jgi:hypothetical protein